MSASILNRAATSLIGPVARCSKCSATAVMWVDVYGLNMANPLSDLPMRIECRCCGKQYPIGPANDASPNVSLEIEAARWAPDIDVGWHALRSLGSCSPNAEHTDILMKNGRLADLREYEIGLLAALIASHRDEEQ